MGDRRPNGQTPSREQQDSGHEQPKIGANGEHTHTHTTFVKMTSIGISRLAIKVLELSLVPPGGRFPHGIYWAYLFMHYIYSESSSKIFQSTMIIFKECVREIYEVLLTNFEQRDFSLGRIFYVHFSTAKYPPPCKRRVCLKYVTAENNLQHIMALEGRKERKHGLF
jgi:hypothetical protein